jgi:hypothetical protein
MIFIPLNVPSSKNNKVWTGSRLIWSKRALLYKKATEKIFLENRDSFINMILEKEKPYLVGFHFVRNSKHKWDFVNMVQTIQDLMVLYNYLEDDNVDNMLPVPMVLNNLYYTYDKDNPGVYIKIL